MNQPQEITLDTQLSNLPFEDDRAGLTIETLRRAFIDNLFYVQGKFPGIATKNDYYMALAYTVRDRLLHCWINTTEAYFNQKESKLVCTYLPSSCWDHT